MASRASSVSIWLQDTWMRKAAWRGSTTQGPGLFKRVICLSHDVRTDHPCSADLSEAAAAEKETRSKNRCRGRSEKKTRRQKRGSEARSRRAGRREDQSQTQKHRHRTHLKRASLSAAAAADSWSLRCSCSADALRLTTSPAVLWATLCSCCVWRLGGGGGVLIS